MTKAHKIIGFSALALGVLFLWIGIGHSATPEERSERERIALCGIVGKLAFQCFSGNQESCDLLQVKEDRFFGTYGGEAWQDCRPDFLEQGTK